MPRKKSKVTPKNNLVCSLAYARFERGMDLDSRHYWCQMCANEYATKWWNAIPKTQWPAVVSNGPDGNIDPFLRVVLSPVDYLEFLKEGSNIVRQNSIVSFITIFENYLHDVFERAIFLAPERISNSDGALKTFSDIKYSVVDLIKPAQDGDLKIWLAKNIADNFQRSLTHKQLIAKLNVIVRHGVNADDPDVLEWNKWELLRHAIVHASRRATRDLVRAWPGRYGKAGDYIKLTDGDITAITSLARRLAARIDARFNEEIVRENDTILLIREIYVRFGIEDMARINGITSRYTKEQLESKHVKSIIKKQKETEESISGYDFESLFSKEEDLG